MKIASGESNIRVPVGDTTQIFDSPEAIFINETVPRSNR